MATRILIVLSLIFLLDLYVFKVFRSFWQETEGPWKTGLDLVFWSFTFLTFFYFLAYANGWTAAWNKDFLVISRAFLFILYLSKFVAASMFLVDDVRRLAVAAWNALDPPRQFDAGRSRFMAQAGILIGALPLFTMTYGVIRNRYRYNRWNVRIPIKGLPKALSGLRIVQISDIHSGSFTEKEPLWKAVDMIRDCKPDLVFFTGDLVNSKADEMLPYRDVFGSIEARYGVYSIFGNHDYGDYAAWSNMEEKRANLSALADIHRQMGWDLLRNEHRVLDIAGHKLGIVGVENYSALPQFQKYGDLDKAVDGMEPVDLKLLLSHDPSHWESQVLPRHPDIAVTFSGHTHGFQFGIEIPGLFRWSPSQYMYKQWAGLYSEGDRHLYVNRGLGFLGFPGRVGILPEITCVELVSA